MSIVVLERNSHIPGVGKMRLNSKLGNSEMLCRELGLNTRKGQQNKKAFQSKVNHLQPPASPDVWQRNCRGWQKCLGGGRGFKRTPKLGVLTYYFPFFGRKLRVNKDDLLCELRKITSLAHTT